ncbi:ABC transporter ATP-binding protein [Lacrimispora sp. JR3]|uniref:ABC transporter ATP-binding protein n=1 Tax=Lacrimispora sinapis TaxID=3111456 RepID=UPI003747A7AC
MTTLETKGLTLSYRDCTIIKEMDLSILPGKITVFVGRNGCGKSTLLRAVSRLIKPEQGTVLLEGKEIHKWSTREVAKRMAILPQSPHAPEGLTVKQLVRQGRYPHQNFMSQWSKEDERLVEKALKDTGMSALMDRSVDSLSGGQRQRAWIAMTLAQNTGIILLDEPTTYLDLAHQIEILDLLYELNAREHCTIIMVLHDLNLACRYAHQIVAISDQTVMAQGAPEEVMTTEMVREVFGIECDMMKDSLFGTPVFLPHGKGRRVET